MKIMIESTTKVIDVNGVPARMWEGYTESGIPVHCYVTRIAISADADLSEFQRELKECVAPSPDVEVIPGRLIL